MYLLGWKINNRAIDISDPAITHANVLGTEHKHVSANEKNRSCSM
jgi:hypothetical protein